MKEDKCYFRPFRKSMFSFLVGGVLLSCLLALTPNSVSATSDMTIQPVNSGFSEIYGCNTVKSEGGVLAVGARGSYFGTDDNDSGCGYYMTSQYNLSFRDTSVYGGCSWLDTGAFSSCSTPTYPNSTSLNDDSYINMGFRTSVSNVHSNGLNYLVNIPKITVASSKNYGEYAYIILWKVKPNASIASHKTPTFLIDNDTQLVKLVNNSSVPFNDSELMAFNTDIYSHTIFEFGSPKDYISDALYQQIMSDYGFTQDSDFDTYDIAYSVVYFPQYSFEYTFNQLKLSVAPDIVQNTIDLGGFSAQMVGWGNNSSSTTFPKLDYLYMSNPYTKNGFNSGTNILYDMRAYYTKCLSTSCIDDGYSLATRANNKHESDNAGWDFSSNPAGTWFNVFNFGIKYPLSALFGAFTNQGCVDIPIISSWIHSVDTQYCTWWSPTIRDTLTPVFNTISLMILFGFIVHWLSGRSSTVVSNAELYRSKK